MTRNKLSWSRTVAHTPIIPTLRRLKQKDLKCEARLGYMVKLHQRRERREGGREEKGREGRKEKFSQ
jgi:hypothetical protein